jgi:hypothetical protein
MFTQPLPLQHRSHDSFSIAIKNTDTVSHAFYPLTVFDQPGNYYFVDKQSVYDRLVAKSTQIDALREVLRIVKSPAFRNFWVESTDYNSSGLIQELVEKRYAVAGFALGSASYKCGHFRYFAARTLIDAGIFEPEDVRIVSADNHQIVEFRIDGKWVGFDTDPGEPYAIGTFANGTNMSIEDVLQYPENLKKYVWYGTSASDSVLFFPERSSSEYLAKLTNIVYWPVEQVQPVDISGIWKLCPGAELIWSYQLPRLVDTTEAMNKLMYDSASAAIAQHDYLLAGEVMSRWLGLSGVAEAVAAFEQGTILFTNGTLPNLLRSSSYQNNELVLKVHTGSQPVVLGKDLTLPMTIASITTTNPVTVGDTVFPVGYSRMVRYNKKDFTDFADRDEVPLQTAKQFQYLSVGSIPAYTDVEFHLCYNQLMYPFLYGLQVEAFGDAVDKLTVTASSPVTGINEVNNKSINPLPDGIYTIEGSAINGFAGAPTGIYVEKKGSSIKKVSVVR